MSEWWEDAPLAPADDPSFTGYIPGSPKVDKPRDPLAIRNDELDIQKKERDLAKSDEDDPQKKALQAAISGLGIDELVTNIGRARGNLSKGWSTGITGAVASHIPGTQAADFRAALDSIKGAIVLEKMQSLKEASKTGASGLGALSDKEGDRLAASIAALNPNMSDEALAQSLDDIERHAKTLQAVRDGKDPTNADVQRQYQIPPANGATQPPATGDGPPPPGVGQLTAEQKHAYEAFIAASGGKPDTGQLKAFLENLTGKTVTNAEAIAKSIGSGKGFSTQVDDLTYQQKVRERLDRDRRAGFGEDPATTLVKQGATLALSDEAGGVGNAAANIINSPFTGNFDPVGSYKFGRDVERQRIDEARDQLGWGGTALELAGGFASASPGNALAAFAPRAATAAAATGGALAGFGSGEGTQDSLVRGGVGAAGGAAIQHIVPNAAERLLRLGGRGMAPDLARASEAEGVDLIRPMVDPESRSNYGALESNVYSQPIIRGAAARVRGQIEDRVEGLGVGGIPLDRGAAGEKLQASGNRFIMRSRGVKDRLYRRAENIAADTRIEPAKALQQVDDEIAQLSGNEGSNAAEISFLQTIRNDLAKPGGKTVAEIRNIREGLRGEIGRSNLTMSGAEARALRVLTAATDDIADKVPEAATAFRRADAFYRERQTVVDDVKRAILGKPSDPLDPQKAFANLSTLSSPGGNQRRLAAVMRNLEPDERQDIAATVAQSLGRRSPDEPFSTALFLSQARKISPSAQRTIFGEGGAQSIENLRLLSQKLEEAGQDINRSRSATVLERQGIRNAARSFIGIVAGLGGQAATGSLAGGVAGAGVAVGAMGASAARRVLSARAMVNPRVSRWLAQSADASTPQQAQEAIRRLGLIISREPALANELQPIYDMLNQRVTPRLAADQPEGGNNE